MGAETAVIFVFTLDTNILVYYAGGDPAVSDFLLNNLKKNVTLYLPTAVIVEFFSYPAITPRDQTMFESLLPQCDVIPLDFAIALRAANIRSGYKLKLGDSVVAATTLHTHSTLVTRNVRDFKKIPELKILKV